MNEPAPPPAPRYKFVQYGGGVEELDRLAVRDRIRSGDITGASELAVAGTDDWRPAATFPEFGRYFEVAAAEPRTMPGTVPVKTGPPPEPMRKRLIDGLLYPIAGGEALLLIGLAIFSVLPGPAFGKFLSFWALFYVSHLLGYAVYRHVHELGWE